MASLKEKILEGIEKASDYMPNVVTRALPVIAGGKDTSLPTQKQDQQPGVEAEMTSKPVFIDEDYKGSSKLAGKVALITGGDSGIGRSVAVHFAREGARAVLIGYYTDEEEVDARETIKLVEAEGSQCVAFQGDVGVPEACKQFVQLAIDKFGQLDILVSNAAVQHYQHSILEISPEQLQRTFATNIFGAFYMAQAAIPHLKPGSSIIITTSITAYEGEPHLVDYSSTKGCLTTFMRSLSQQLIEKGIRVNAVAPGPIWAPLIPATFPKAAQAAWHKMVPMARAGQPAEVAPSYVLLASEDGSYFTGQVLHPNGGAPVSA